MLSKNIINLNSLNVSKKSNIVTISYKKKIRTGHSARSKQAWNQCNVIYFATNKIWDCAIYGVSYWLQFEYMSDHVSVKGNNICSNKHLYKFIRSLTSQAQVSFYAVLHHNR